MSKLKELIGRLCPDGVEFIKLSSIGVFENIGVDKKTRPNEPLVQLLNYVDVYKNKYIDASIPSMTVSAPIRKIQDCDIRQWDLFITPTSETRDDIGHTAVVIEDMPNVVYSYHIMRFRLNNPNKINACFINYIFESIEVQKQIYRFASGLTRFGLSKYKFGDIEIPFPPIEVQEEIVRILDCFAAYSAELQAELQARKEQYEYYRNLLLTFNPSACGCGTDDAQEIKVTTWGGDSYEIVWKTMGEICVNHDRKRKPITASKRNAGRFPYYGASGIVDYVDSYIFDGEYLLISEDGANLLTRSTPIAFPISGKNWVNNHAHVLEFESKVTQRYIEFYFNMIDISKYVSGGAQPKLNQESLNSIIIPIPPLALQEKIVAILDRFEALVNDLTLGLPAEIAAVKERYEYHRNKLLTFKQAV
ncbi:MAG: restriction endonuclease subunit S [Prevotella sp.]|nr:restriction endonuclease subunit S [Prevotella sp.]